MTYRLMAEMTTDLVCQKLNVNKKCETRTTPLPGSGNGDVKEVSGKIWTKPTTAQKAAAGRQGILASKLDFSTKEEQSLVCECEEVPESEVTNAIENLDVHNLVDLRRRTRVGMGTCQGELCACRAAGLLAKAHGSSHRDYPIKMLTKVYPRYYTGPYRAILLYSQTGLYIRIIAARLHSANLRMA